MAATTAPDARSALKWWIEQPGVRALVVFEIAACWLIFAWPAVTRSWMEICVGLLVGTSTLIAQPLLLSSSARDPYDGPVVFLMLFLMCFPNPVLLFASWMLQREGKTDDAEAFGRIAWLHFILCLIAWTHGAHVAEHARKARDEKKRT